MSGVLTYELYKEKYASAIEAFIGSAAPGPVTAQEIEQSYTFFVAEVERLFRMFPELNNDDMASLVWMHVLLSQYALAHDLKPEVATTWETNPQIQKLYENGIFDSYATLLARKRSQVIPQASPNINIFTTLGKLQSATANPVITGSKPALNLAPLEPPRPVSRPSSVIEREAKSIYASYDSYDTYNKPHSGHHGLSSNIVALLGDPNLKDGEVLLTWTELVNNDPEIEQLLASEFKDMVEAKTEIKKWCGIKMANMPGYDQKSMQTRLSQVERQSNPSKKKYFPSDRPIMMKILEEVKDTLRKAIAKKHNMS